MAGIWDQLNPNSYAFKARTQPVLFVSVPLAAAVWSWASSWIGAWSWMTGFLVAAGLPRLLGEIAADRGRAKERALWESWEGPPTTRALRHRTAQFNPHTLQQIHLSLERLAGLRIPTATEERENPLAADEVYSACVDRVRVIAREQKDDYKVVHERNVDYGFRRNLWAIRPWGYFSSGVAMALALLQIYLFGGPPAALLVIGLAGLAFSFLALVVGSPWVRRAADSYARGLLECTPRMAESKSSQITPPPPVADALDPVSQE